MGHRFEQIPIALDQLVNTIFGGYADETISAASYRKRNESTGWRLMGKLIDCIFFWQENHCQQAYQSEIERKHLPKEYRGTEFW